jgi:hypothetical protein
MSASPSTTKKKKRKKEMKRHPAIVVQGCYKRFLKGGDWEDHSWKPAWVKRSGDPHLNQ